MTNKRKKVQDKILDVVLTIDPSRYNYDKYLKMFEDMDDKAFDNYMQDIKNKKIKLTMFAPNLEIAVQNKDLLEAAKKVNLNLFERIWMYDNILGIRYLTKYKYLILKLPVRRVKQFLLHKLSVAESDKVIDTYTGQVVADDQASALSYVEAQLLYSRGLEATITELLKVRGGDIKAFTNVKRQLEETGVSTLNQLDQNTVARSSVTLTNVLKCMYLDNNLIGD